MNSPVDIYGTTSRVVTLSRKRVATDDVLHLTGRVVIVAGIEVESGQLKRIVLSPVPNRVPVAQGKRVKK
jgi:hypothetical protein